ncbi:MAG: hypothetical protein KAI67_03660 [Candidatus Pacebacteria bacterium]|nr:hypothetical protein [Candidatus Paceibacterota bacterium]
MESLTINDTENNDPQITVAFKCQNCGEKNTNVLIANYDGNKIVPRKDGWMPREGVLYVCERPWLGKPSFYTDDGTPVFSILVHPWIIGNLKNEIVDMVFVNSKYQIDKDTLPQATFGAEAIVYCEVGETKYVWIKDPQHVETIKIALTETEYKRRHWEKVKGNENLLKAPYHGVSRGEVEKVIAETISK